MPSVEMIQLITWSSKFQTPLTLCLWKMISFFLTAGPRYVNVVASRHPQSRAAILEHVFVLFSGVITISTLSPTLCVVSVSLSAFNASIVVTAVVLFHDTPFLCLVFSSSPDVCDQFCLTLGVAKMLCVVAATERQLWW